MHWQVHGVVPHVSARPLPGLDIADNGLAALVNVYMLNCDLLLALAAMAV